MMLLNRSRGGGPHAHRVGPRVGVVIRPGRGAAWLNRGQSRGQQGLSRCFLPEMPVDC